jgi:hypothetical protein
MPSLPRSPRARIAASIQTLIRSFPTTNVHIVRQTYSQTAGRTRGVATDTTIYRGEALFSPAGGHIQVKGLGLYESTAPRLIVAGVWSIRQGDRVTLFNMLYEVEDAHNRWGAFMILKLRQVKQV